MNINKLLKKLTPKEQQDYLKLSKIFSNNLQESTLSKGVEYISKNWKNYSKAMLIALLLNPNISNALSNSNPTVYKEIENSVKKDKNNIFDLIITGISGGGAIVLVIGFAKYLGDIFSKHVGQNHEKLVNKNEHFHQISQESYQRADPRSTEIPRRFIQKPKKEENT